MLSQASQNIIFHAFFTKTKAGVAPSSAPTVSIERKGSGSLIVSGGTTTAGLITGHYTYTLAAASDATADDYLAVFHTSDATVDFQDVPSLWVVGNSFAAAVPNVPAGAANGLPTIDSGGGSLPYDLGGSVSGNVAGDIHGKLLGGGINTPTAVGAWVADGSGNPVGTAANQTTLLTRVSAARAGYLDNLNVGGAVASHADITALNTSASKHLLLVTVGQFEPGETYTVEMRTFAASTGAAVNADTTPTLTATGNVSGDLSANLSAATNPATGLYRWTYTPGATPTLEQIRFDGAAAISASTFTLSAYSQTVDFATAVFTATDQTHLTSIFNKLPAGGALIGDATATTQNAIKAKTDLIATNAADSPEVATAVGTISTLLTRVTGPVMLAASYAAPDNADIAAIVAVTNKVNTMLATSGLNWAYTVDALKNAPAGGGGGGSTVNITIDDQTVSG